MTIWDKRLTPARPDLAALHLQGKVTAGAFVEGRHMRVIEEVIGLRREPSPEASLETQAIYGEEVMVYEDHEGWAWGQLLRDGYVGYFPANALRPPSANLTHKVAVPRSFVWPGASIKHPVLTALPLGAQLSVVDQAGHFSRLADGSFAWTAHLAPVAEAAPDFVSIAEQFLNVPYLWGGKTSQGLDCSGLAQIALQLVGIEAPRDSDMQERDLGKALEVDDSLAGLQRGDLAFWRGHVGVMQDATTVLHANGHHMLVASEPLEVARDRILAKSHGPITSVRRIR